MRNGLKIFGLAAVAALSLTALAVQDGVVLKRIAKSGDTMKFRLKAELEVQGTPVVLTGLINEKVTGVAANGNITVEQKTTDVKLDFGGSEMNPPATDDTTTTTYTPFGTIVDIKSTQTDANLARMSNLQSITIPEKPLKVGDTWDITLPKNEKGAVELKGTFKVDGAEKIGVYDTYRVKGTMKETTGDQPASVDATYWINVKDASLVKLTGTWTNAPLPQIGPSNAKITLMREG